MRKMTNERKIQILTVIVTELMEGKARLVSRSEFKRSIGNLSKKTGISEDEIREIIELIIRQKTDEMLAR